jgi:hypothetical protein
MKKTTKEHPITFFRKANEARQKLVKKSMGGPGDPPGTPFQSYMKTPGATAADTSAATMGQANRITANKPLLTKAYELTYGQDYGDDSTGNPYSKEELPKRRGSHSGYKDMSNPMRKAYEAQVSKYTQKKKGGSVKRKK